MCENSELSVPKGRHWWYNCSSLGPDWGPEHFMDKAHLDLDNSIWSWGQNHPFLRVGEGTWQPHSNNAGEIICPCGVTSRAASCPWALSAQPWRGARCSHHVGQCESHWSVSACPFTPQEDGSCWVVVFPEAPSGCVSCHAIQVLALPDVVLSKGSSIPEGSWEREPGWLGCGETHVCMWFARAEQILVTFPELTSCNQESSLTRGAEQCGWPVFNNYEWITDGQAKAELIWEKLLFTNVCKVVLIWKNKPKPNSQPVSDLIVFLALVLKLTLWTGLREENPQMLFKNTHSKIIDAAFFYEVPRINPCIDLFPGGYPSVCSV